MFLVILSGGVVVVVPTTSTTSTTSSHQVGRVAGTGAVATAEAVAPTEDGAIALVEAVGVDLPQLESITGPGSVPGGHFWRSDWRSDWSNTADTAGSAVEESLLKSPPAQATLQCKLSESPRLLVWWSLTGLVSLASLTPDSLRVEGTFLRVVWLVLVDWLVGQGRSEGEPGVERLQQVSPVQPD